MVAVLQPSFSYFFFFEIRHDLTVFHEASEKNVVWVLLFIFLYVHVFQGGIRIFLVNIVFTSWCHRVLDFFKYDAYTMKLRRSHDVVLPS